MEQIDKPPTMKGPAEWFTGDVYVDPIAQAQGSAVTIGAVHFTPCARTAWHHHTIGQTLYVTEGEGRVQSRGGPVVTIRPGDVIRIAGGEEHWHGAAPDRFMTHIAITEGDTSWGEHLTDDEYGQQPECALAPLYDGGLHVVSRGACTLIRSATRRSGGVGMLELRV